MSMDEIRKQLCQGEFSSLSMSWNGSNAPNYISVQADLEQDELNPPNQQWFGAEDFTSPEARQKCIDTNSIWTAQWYPQTPVGFCTLHAPTFEELIAGLIAICEERAP